jgi:hypothetical protein
MFFICRFFQLCPYWSIRTDPSYKIKYITIWHIFDINTVKYDKKISLQKFRRSYYTHACTCIEVNFFTLICVSCAKKYLHCSFKCALNKQTRRMSSIVDSYKISSLDLMAESSVSYSVTRDFVYQTKENCNKTGIPTSKTANLYFISY